MPDPKHIHVIGLDAFHLKSLQTVRDSDRYSFHALGDYDAIVLPERYDIPALLRGMRKDLDQAPGVDAIIGHWDFPTTSLLPVLRQEYGVPTPTLESVLYCENKYWNRLACEAAVPECTPAFQGIDADCADPVAELRLPYPFWLKPAVAFSSYLGFRIESETQFREAMAAIREGIHVFSEPFRVLTDLVTDPGQLPRGGSGATVVAEGIIQGRLCTLEGYVHHGEVVTYAILDSLRGRNEVSFVSYQYPSSLPASVQERMKGYARRLLTHIGLDQTPFNMEFFWDEDLDRIWLLEVNPRISKSHCPIFEIATGASHHEVAIDLCLGRHPHFPRAQGRYPMAAKFMPRVYGDARVLRVPDAAQLHALEMAYPELSIQVHVAEGMALSELRGQDSYSYEIAELFIGGEDEERLHEKFRTIMRELDFRFSQPLSTNYD
ncbi:MAG: acetyl-CoA carboxylase biotin carboxylase subunit family protein [Halorhodospira sp.]